MDVGDTVYCRGKAAKIMFIGETTFGTGVWYGIAFQKPYGKNDGSILNTRYFTCAPNHGMFVRESLLSKTPPSDSDKKASDSPSRVVSTVTGKDQVTRTKARHEAAFTVWNQLEDSEEALHFERNRDVSKLMESELRSRAGNMSGSDSSRHDASGKRVVGGNNAMDAFGQSLLTEKIPPSYKGPHLRSMPPSREDCLTLLNWIREHPDEPLHRKYAWMLLTAGVDLFERTTPTSVMRTSIPANDPSVRLRICGDTHGQLADVLWMFLKSGVPSASNIYLFNGDIADRGKHAVEILLLLLAFKLQCPESVLINRGNHESPDMNESYGFADEVRDKYGSQFYLKFLDLFYALPLATVVDERVFVVHGGLFRENSVTLDRLDVLDRHRPCPEVPRTEDDFLLFDLLWSDPMRDLGRAKSIRGVDCLTFGPDVTSEFCAVNGLEVVIRSHQVPSTGRGFEVHHEGKCVTVFSASNYCGTSGNSGASIVFRPGLSFELVEHIAPSLEEIRDMSRETAALTDRVKTINELQGEHSVQSAAHTGHASIARAKRIEAAAAAKHVLSAAEKMEVEVAGKVARLVAERSQTIWWAFWSTVNDRLTRSGLPPSEVKARASLATVPEWTEVLSETISPQLPWRTLLRTLRVRLLNADGSKYLNNTASANDDLSDAFVDFNSFLSRFKVIIRPPHFNDPDAMNAPPPLPGGVNKFMLGWVRGWKEQVLRSVFESMLRADFSLRETLMLVDRNADGMVSLYEFGELLAGLNLDLSDVQVKVLLRTLLQSHLVQAPALAGNQAAATAAVVAAIQEEQRRRQSTSPTSAAPASSTAATQLSDGPPGTSSVGGGSAGLAQAGSVLVHVVHFLTRFKVACGQTLVRADSAEEEAWVRCALAEIGRLILLEAKAKNDKVRKEERRRSSFRSLHMLARFQLADTAGNGFLSHSEFADCLRSLPLSTIVADAIPTMVTRSNVRLDGRALAQGSDEALSLIARCVDCTGSGRINFLEFINAMTVVDSEANRQAKRIALQGAGSTNPAVGVAAAAAAMPPSTDAPAANSALMTNDLIDSFVLDSTCCSTLLTHRSALRKALRIFDPQQTGKCTADELREALLTLNVVLPARDAAPLSLGYIDDLVELALTVHQGPSRKDAAEAAAERERTASSVAPGSTSRGSDVVDYEALLASLVVVDLNPDSPLFDGAVPDLMI